jgi:hypothetical protein
MRSESAVLCFLKKNASPSFVRTFFGGSERACCGDFSHILSRDSSNVGHNEQMSHSSPNWVDSKPSPKQVIKAFRVPCPVWVTQWSQLHRLPSCFDSLFQVVYLSTLLRPYSKSDPKVVPAVCQVWIIGRSRSYRLSSVDGVF